MSAPVNVLRHCKRHGITIVPEGEDAFEFSAPEGMVFGNDSVRRILVLETPQDRRDAVGALDLFKARVGGAT